MAFTDNAKVNLNSNKLGQGVKVNASSNNKGFDLDKALISPFTTIFDVVEDVSTGATRTVEGWVDSLLLSAGKIFSNDTIENALANAVKYDFSGNTIGKIDDWAEDSSWLSADNKITSTIHNVGEGVGGMLPTILVSYYGGPVAGKISLAAGAMGKSGQEALNKGSTIDQAFDYGVLSGGTEVALESIGGIKAFDTGSLGKVFSGGIGKAVKSFAEEGLEEVASDVINPFWEKITYSGKYDSPEINELVESFTVGGLTALAMGGGAKATNIAMYGKEGEKALNKLSEIEELNQQEYDLEIKNKLTADKSKEFAKKRESLVKEFKEITDNLDKESKKYQRLDQRTNVEQSIESNKNFDVKEQVIHKATEGVNKQYGTNIKVEFVDNQTMADRMKTNGESQNFQNVKGDFLTEGYYDPKTETILINKESKTPYAKLLAHEITHVSQHNQLYKQLADDIISTMSQEELINRQNSLKEMYGENVSENQINREIVSDYISNILGSDSKSLINTFTKKPNLFNKIYEWVESKLSKTAKNSEEYSEYKKIRDKMREVISSEQRTQKDIEQSGDQAINEAQLARRKVTPPEGQTTLELDFESKPQEKSEVKTESKKVEPATRKIAKEMKEYNRQQNLTEQDIDKVIEDTEKKVEVVLPGDKKSTIQVVKDKFKEAKEAFKSGKLATYLKTQITDASAGVIDKVKAKYKDNKELRNSKVKELRISVNEAQRATARADWYIGTVVDKIWSPIEAKGEAYVRSFETFLLHKLNIRRMRFSATALNNISKLEKELDAKLVELADKYNKGGYKNKRSYELDVSKTKSKYGAKIKSWQEEYDNAKDAPVFGKEITAKESEEAAKKLLKEHPEFAEYKEQVADVFEYLRKRQLEAGLISETQFELMEKAAGRDYVPTHRANKDGISKAALSGNIGVKNGLYRAKGSSEDIRSIMVQMCEQVIAVEKKTSINKLFNTVKDMIPEEFTDDKIVSREPVGREDADSNIIPEQNQVFFYENGERVVYQVDNEVASLFQSMRNIPSQFELGVFGKASKSLVKLTRNVTTQYNPFFAARNLFRDYFDAVIYTKNKGTFSQNYVEAAKDVFGKGKWYKMYMENGGASASFYNQDQGRDMSKKGILTKISDFNETIELIPRVAEMKSTYERLIAEGKTHEEAIQEAMFDAAEVTVNFGKGGTSTKWLSSNLVPYLNGAVQGSVKFYNTFIHPESFEAWKSSMIRAGMMAIPALILNEALFGDDEDYEELADDVKANYYLFKIGDNKFIRIPRGRIEAIFGDFAQRTVRYAKGNEDAFDTYGETIKSSVSPVESFTRTVYSPLKDVSTNTAWHGGKIENRSMENKPIKERYDENTSEIAKMLSNVYPKLSPKKWHYLLDQYSGVIGDIVLPLTSKSASIETVLFKSSGYYVNSMNNNKYSNQYYDLGAELTQNSNSDKATGVDKAKLRYYNSMNTKISELKKQKAELSDDEANATQLLIVQLQRQTIDNLKAFETTLNKYEYGLSDSDTYEDFYRESLRECFGAETALINYDTRVYEKATIFNKCGINWDTFYTVYFDAKSIDSDYDADGDVVSGSKKTKITNYVKSLKLTATQKYMVMGLLGYKNTNGEQQVRSLLRSKGYNGEELNKIMKMCGYN